MEKKRWEKYKRAMKKLGFTNVGYSYNVQQQRNHTATIALASVDDPENSIQEAKNLLADELKILKRATDRARFDYSYIKRNRHTYDELFIPAAKRDLAQNKDGAESYLQYCLDECSHYDDGSYLEWKTKNHIEDIKKHCHNTIENCSQMPTRSEQVTKTKEFFDQVASAVPTKELLDEIHGQIIFDDPGVTHQYGTIYARFQW